MATTTLNAVLWRVGELTQPDWVYGHADPTDGSAVHFFDVTRLVMGGAQGNLWGDGWALFPARVTPNRQRDITTVDQATGKVTLVRAVDTPIGDEDYHLWSKWNPRRVAEQAQRAQEDMWALTDYTLTGADLGDELRQVDLTALLPWVVSAGQVEAVRLRAGSSGAYTRRGVQGWSPPRDVSASGGVVTLDLALETFARTDALQLRLWRSYHSLSPLDEAQASAAPLDWLAWETIYRLASLPDYEDAALQARAAAMLDDFRSEDSGPQSYRLFERVGGSWGPLGYGR